MLLGKRIKTNNDKNSKNGKDCNINLRRNSAFVKTGRHRICFPDDHSHKHKQTRDLFYFDQKLCRSWTFLDLCRIEIVVIIEYVTFCRKNCWPKIGCLWCRMYVRISQSEAINQPSYVRKGQLSYFFQWPWPFSRRLLPVVAGLSLSHIFPWTLIHQQQRASLMYIPGQRWAPIPVWSASGSSRGSLRSWHVIVSFNLEARIICKCTIDPSELVPCWLPTKSW